MDDVDARAPQGRVAALRRCNRWEDAQVRRQFFRSAERSGLVKSNPFAGIKGPSEVNESRKRFVSRETIAEVLALCPDAEWRLIVVLSRYGGLRCPSEHLALTWPDVDWARGRFLVKSPKTGPRWVPTLPRVAAVPRRGFRAGRRRRRPRHHQQTGRDPEPANTHVQDHPPGRHHAMAPACSTIFARPAETELVAEHPLHVVSPGWGTRR